MRAEPADLRGSATILRAAMDLFAVRGLAAVSVRDIAEAAGVSPSLVIHHYRSKQGLKDATDDRVLRLLEEVLSAAAGATTPAAAVGSMEESLAERLERSPLLLPYLRRMLVDGGPAADALYRRLLDITRQGLQTMREAGIIREVADEEALATSFLVNDLAVIVFRDQIRDSLGFDPLAGDGLRRWGATVMDVYGRGIFVGPLPGAPS